MNKTLAQINELIERAMDIRDGDHPNNDRTNFLIQVAQAQALLAIAQLLKDIRDTYQEQHQ